MLLFELAVSQEVNICSWNLKDFGKSKSDQTLEFIARTLDAFDIIAIQEVVAGAGGPQAVTKLTEKLNKGGKEWLYEVSPVTSGTTTNERYAFIWKSTKVKKQGKGWLDSNYRSSIKREPFLSRFAVNGKSITVVSFHALPKTKNPEVEIKYLQFFPKKYPLHRLLFCGDFNLPQTHTVFNTLKSLNYLPALLGQKTSLRQQCLDDDCLASEYDNFYVNQTHLNVLESGVLHFYRLFDNLKAAKKVSDHLPIYMRVMMN